MAAETPSATAGGAQRLGELLEHVEAIPDAGARAIAEELTGAVVGLYGTALERIVAELSGEQRAALAGDELVGGLLAVHDLHPVPLEQRVGAALERVRPYMASHGGDVELLGVADGVARLRLQGSCRSCHASSVTLELAVRQALEELCPDLEGMDVEGAEPEPASRVTGVALPMAVAPPAPPSSRVEEACDLCGRGLPGDHRHLLDLEQRLIVCTCEGCWALRAGEPQFAPVGRRTQWLEDFALPDDLWASFGIPIGLAFFLRSSGTDGVVALYPSPAGATESELRPAEWRRLVELNPALGDLAPDAEALVINRLAGARQHAIVPIDRAYELVGLVKRHWSGISGGRDVDEAVARFFADLRGTAVVA